MSVTYDNFVFASPPRTGISWFTKACEKVGLTSTSLDRAYFPFSSLENTSYKVSLVRHPYYWLVSYYYKASKDKLGIPELDALGEVANRDSITSHRDFLISYLNSCSGQVGRIFNLYEADTCLRIEDMPFAAVELFLSLGVPSHLAGQCKSIAHQNRDRNYYQREASIYSAISHAERSFMEKYDYF